jgi:3-hydroxyisobutyrate dehydrogenase-like beta-hydroxyacid dehydrogenase
MAHMDDQLSVTVLGLGPMGSALARAFLRHDHATTVWNRTAAKADALVAEGASRADTVDDAVTASRIVISCVADYDAMYDVLGSSVDALRGRLLVNLSSGTPEQARQAAAWAEEHGVDYLDGAIMVPVPAVGQPDAVILYSGDRTVFDTHRSTLDVLGGASSHVGTDPGLAVLYNTALLGFMYATVNGFYHAAALVGTAGVSATEFESMATGWFLNSVVVPILDDQAPKIDAGEFAGTIDTTEMNLTALEHVTRTSEDHEVNAALPRHLAELTRQAIADGLAGESYASMIKYYRGPRKG